MVLSKKLRLNVAVLGCMLLLPVYALGCAFPGSSFIYLNNYTSNALYVLNVADATSSVNTFPSVVYAGVAYNGLLPNDQSWSEASWCSGWSWTKPYTAGQVHIAVGTPFNVKYSVKFSASYDYLTRDTKGTCEAVLGQVSCYAPEITSGGNVNCKCSIVGAAD